MLPSSSGSRERGTASKPFYGVDARIGPGTALVLGLQHVLAMFVGIVTPPLLVARALALDLRSTTFLVSMSLFTSGLNTWLQVRRLGPVGSGLLSVQGTSFVFVPLAIETARAGGLPLVFGMTAAGALVPMIASRFIAPARRIFPPVVTGAVVMLIGISLIRVGFAQLAGGYGAPDFGSPAHLGLGLLVVAVIVALHRFARGAWQTVSIAGGLVAGYAAAIALGRVSLAEAARAPWVIAPEPLRFGLAFDVNHLLPWVVAYVVVAVECIGDLTATASVSREPVSGAGFLRRLEGGVLADGLGCLITSFFNALPKTTFAQNNGLIAMTGVASRRVGYAVAALLVVLGLSPRLAALVSLVPHAVLGGATVIMFSMVAVAGFDIVRRGGFGPKRQFTLALTLGLGLGVSLVPEATAKIPWPTLRVLCESGLAVGIVTAVAMHALFGDDEEMSAGDAPDPR